MFRKPRNIKVSKLLFLLNQICHNPSFRNHLFSTHLEEHDKTATQVCLRFLVQQNIVAIPRTSKEQRLAENAAIFDFSLSAAEMTEIAHLANRDGRIIDWAYAGRPQWD